MAKILFLIADYYSSTKSTAKNVASTFVRQYIEDHPKDEVSVLNLCEYPFPRVDRSVLDAWEKQLSGLSFEELPEVQRKKVGEINELSSAFFESDKFVVVSPNWNGFVPPQLVDYFLSVLRLGSAYSIDEEKLVGLMQGKKKKVFMIQSSLHLASDPSAPDYAMGVGWVKRVFARCGVADFEVMFIEGFADHPERRDEILRNANVDAQIFATTF